MKLINWTQCPTGVKVIDATTGLHGLMLENDSFKASVFFSGIYDFGLFNCLDLRLAPALQQNWLVYEDGVTVLPEWAVCLYRGVTDNGLHGVNERTCGNISDLTFIFQYRIRGIKEGWTDNPYEVTE